MTQSTSISPEKEVVEAQEKRQPNPIWGASLLTIAGLLFSIIGFTIVVIQDWRDYILVGAPVLLFVFGLISIILLRQNKLVAGASLVFVANLILPIAEILFQQGIGVVVFIYTLVSSVLLIWRSMPNQTRRWTVPLTGITLAFIVVVEIVQPAFRLGTEDEVVALVSIVTALLVISFLFQAVTEAWNRSYTIGRKLQIGFGLLGVLSLVLGVVFNYGLRDIRTSFEHALEDGGELKAISLSLSKELSTARRLENDFLLLWTEEGFNNAYTNYALANQETVVAMRQDITSMFDFAPTIGETFGDTYPQTEYTSDLNNLRESVDAYERNFQKAVQLIEEKGFKDEGLEGEFRDAVQDIEDRIYDREGLEPLVITMLSIRRHEKDYLLRGDQTYIDQTHESVEKLKQQISASELLNAPEKAQMRLLADQYIVAFDALVEKDFEIAVATQEFNFAADTMEPIVEKLTNIGQEMSQLDIATAESQSNQTRAITTITLVITLGITVFLALFLSRQISDPVRLLTNTASEIAGGNFDVQAEVTSADEIGTLAETFNTMTKRLGEAFEDVRRRAAELSTVAEVSTATSTILDSKQLLQNVVDLTKERFNLYHSHIYLLDEQGQNLVLTAGAGEPGRVMVAEGRSIPLNREQSLVARSARERQGVTVNDVTQATDHLPNPLLPDTRSELAVPMLVGGNVIGVFDIQSEQVGRFTETDVNIQTTLAAQLATSIQNVRSFERSKKEAELQSLVNLISSRIQRTTSIEETLQTAIRELGTAIGASSVKAKINSSNGNN